MKKDLTFSDEAKAFIMIKVLYQQGVINKATYDAINEKYLVKGDSNDVEESNTREL